MATRGTETPDYYMDNAKAELAKAGIDSKGYYTHRKYVRGGASYAYKAVLLALAPFVAPKAKGRLAKEDYTASISRLGGDTRTFESVYSALRLSGEYDGTLDSAIIKRGLLKANELIAWAARVGRSRK